MSETFSVKTFQREMQYFATHLLLYAQKFLFYAKKSGRLRMPRPYDFIGTSASCTSEAP